MPTVKLVEENCEHPIVRRVFADIKATKKIDLVPNIWRALATDPNISNVLGHGSRRSCSRAKSIC